MGSAKMRLVLASTLPLNIHLGMCILKKDPMDAVLGRVVELGVREITPIVSDHCAVSTKMIKNRQTHWQAVIISDSMPMST